MGQFLVFRLDAIMGSMGLQAGNERRGTDRWPARSAVRGLIGAALGVDRQNREGQHALQHGYAMAISMPAGDIGSLIVDFHTAQSVASTTARRPGSRRQALQVAGAARNLETVLTLREYHEDCLFDVAIEARPDAKWSLDEIAKALSAPTYVLYLGRKACPLTAPVYPRIVPAVSVGVALRDYALIGQHAAIRRTAVGRSIPIMADSVLAPPVTPADRSRRTRRRDAIRDRGAWLFDEDAAVHFEVEGANG